MLGFKNKINVFLICTSVFLINTFANAEQPWVKRAQKVYLETPCVQHEIKILIDNGYLMQDTAVNLISAHWTDEGVQGYYLSSTYFEKGDQPWSKLSKTILGIIEIAQGQVASVKCLDPQVAVLSLLSPQTMQ